MGSTTLDLVRALPRVSCAPLGMFCALGDGMCLSRAFVNEEYGCDAKGETRSTDAPHPDLLVLREPVEGDGIRKPSGYGALGLAVAGLDFSLLRS